MNPMTENQLLNAVIDLAKMQGWLVHHDRPARRQSGNWSTPIQGHAGFPDLVLARNGVVLFRELKGYSSAGRLGHLSNEQLRWGHELDLDWSGTIRQTDEHRRGLLFDDWTPLDWDTLIVPTLTAKMPARTS